MIPACENVRWNVSRRVLQVFIIGDFEVFTLLASVLLIWWMNPVLFKASCKFELLLFACCNLSPTNEFLKYNKAGIPQTSPKEMFALFFSQNSCIFIEIFVSFLFVRQILNILSDGICSFLKFSNE